MTVILDSGIRRGTDVIKALALGAQFVFVGRPFLYAAVAAGEPGVCRAISLLKEEVRPRHGAARGAQHRRDHAGAGVPAGRGDPGLQGRSLKGPAPRDASPSPSTCRRALRPQNAENGKRTIDVCMVMLDAARYAIRLAIVPSHRACCGAGVPARRRRGSHLGADLAVNRIIDRSQALNAIGPDDPARAHLRADIQHLKRRAALLNNAIFFSTVSAIVTTILVIVAFASALALRSDTSTRSRSFSSSLSGSSPRRWSIWRAKRGLPSMTSIITRHDRRSTARHAGPKSAQSGGMSADLSSAA